jgi:hypothetical protein
MVTGGDEATLVRAWYDGEKRRLLVGYIGEGGLEAGVAYVVRDGRFTAVQA